MFLDASARKVEYIGNSFINYLTFDDVKALGEGRIVFACLAPALIGESNGVTQCGVGKGEGRGVGYGTRDVSHTIVHNAFLDVNRIAVGSGSRGFETAALVDGNIDKHCARFHEVEHLAGDQMWCLVAWYKYTSYDDIHCWQHLADVML